MTSLTKPGFLVSAIDSVVGPGSGSEIRLRLEHQAVERAELRRMCSELRIPDDFDVAQISWHPDYDPFFYRQLSRRARRIYLFREEYIFDLEKAVVVETPQLGPATYVFAKPRSMDSFLALYTDMQNGVAERSYSICTNWPAATGGDGS